MAILPVPLARVSNLLRAQVAQSSIDTAQQQLLTVQNQISTGKRLNAPSDDPGDAAVVQQLQKTLETRKAYADNLKQADGSLGAVDGTLGDLNDLLQQAQDIASANVGSDVTAGQRQAAAQVVKSLQDQALSLANKQVNGVYLFGGDRSRTAPFVDSGDGGIKFVGSSAVLSNAVDEGTNVAFQVDGGSVFGALSTRVQGATDLTPAVTPDTRLIDLGGAAGDGVQPGTFTIGDGAKSATVDLSKADTVGNVVDTINNALAKAGIDATVSLAGTRLRVDDAGGANLTIADAPGSTAARDLGLATPDGGGGASVAGQSLQAKVTALTPLADLKGGAGIDTAHGLKISNGGKSATIDLSGAKTVEDLLNAVNGSPAGVLARVNAAGTGIDIVNPTQGTAMTVGENGGTTAADLGVRSFGPDTPLAQLNGGKGVGTANGPDFQITAADGTVIPVDLGSAATVQQAIDAINTAGTPAGVTAGFSADGTGIVLTDASGGAGTFSVAPLNGSTAAADLGLNQPATGNTIRGGSANAVTAEGVFGNLAKLYNALQASDQAGITSAAQGLKSDYDRVTSVRGQTGARVQDVEARQTQLDNENIATQSLLSDLQDTDMTAAISKFTQLQTALQASLQTSAKVLNLSLLDFLG